MTHPNGNATNYKTLKFSRYMTFGEQKHNVAKLRTEIGCHVKHTSAKITLIMLSLPAFTKFVPMQQTI